MKNLTKIIYNIGKFWLAIILFLAMIISTVVSLPFIVAGKLADFWSEHQIRTNKNQITDYSS
ncbi:hypothetical protein [Dyadobacter psychrotolerans]|uniref:Uncharacterized protein n=1 Tax=Dyadobacter psychrotolerans TaxID=2541721 RepID=A0A4R5E266_9BACT|nr:hypothetical protein [Dyadobacter psychrotolerans]TDE18355.1 hypothetical protein E0F88_02095 [Dyadobacter psychrotolerans]